ncbi:unnamed protein product [Didymodactylos carnosus]|uniref:Uncharacterized protein n=1 Tax=Didymodactylos carnosus TaxID=1234261 RepID=A0A815YTZ4_9BILA|nr:unnamed protein product [Didymodactylos carnosus]CAF4441271.1 unnamed protein product [Didymodactylos carnosus]
MTEKHLSTNRYKQYKFQQNFIVKCIPWHDGPDIRKQLNDKLLIHRVQNLKRLQVDKHFAIHTIFLVCEYLLCCTPYAVVALLQIFNLLRGKQYPITLTLCACMAKWVSIF